MELTSRQDVLKLSRLNGIGIELGVAEGVMSERLLQQGRLSYLYSVDMYADRSHNVGQYKRALTRLEPFKERNSILVMKFSEALSLFPDNHFDFIYIDGYAHGGQENGQTLRDWYPKCKPGGIFSGDDYDTIWPLVIKEVDAFVKERKLELAVINCHEKDPWSRSPTWYVKKPV